jgi:hypothetical protein
MSMDSLSKSSALADRSRRAFPLLVLIAALAAGIGGIEALPPRDVPAYALDSGLVYKCEVALTLFLVLYLLVVAIALSFEGRTVGKITTAGFELPSDLSSPMATLQALVDRQDQAEQKLIERDRRVSRDIERTWEMLERSRCEDDGSGG